VLMPYIPYIHAKLAQIYWLATSNNQTRVFDWWTIQYKKILIDLSFIDLKPDENVEAHTEIQSGPDEGWFEWLGPIGPCNTIKVNKRKRSWNWKQFKFALPHEIC